MLHHSGKIFLKVASISAGTIPTCYLDILEVEHDGSSKFRGQVRYNFDPRYSKSGDEIRVSFDCPTTNWISPTKGGTRALEDLVVCAILWLIKDNHYLYSTVPNEKAKALMVIHSYQEDKPEMNDINASIANTLKNLGGEVRNGDEWIVSADSINYKYISSIINR